MTSVWINGFLVAPADARIGALGAGVLTGFGVFESMKVVRGQAFALTRHLRRLHSSASIVGLDIPFDDAEIRAGASDVLATFGHASRLRVTVTAGPNDETPPSVIIHGAVTPPWAETSHIVVSPWVRNERAPSAGAKTTSYIDNVLALRHAHASGADEAIMCDTRGHLSEGAACNIFLAHGQRLFTPALSNGCLGGMTREILIGLVDVTEKDDLTVADLRNADEVFVTSSTRDVHPVATVDGVPPRLVRGPVTAQAAEALATVQGRDIDP